MGVSVAMAAAIGAIASCSDAPTAARPANPDFVAEGIVYNRIWLPTKAGLRLNASSEMPTVMSTAGGKLTSKLHDATLIKTDSATARATRFGGTTELDRLLANSLAKTVIRGRKVAAKVIDGKRIAVVAVPDADRRSGRPARATVTVVDDQIAAITEYNWGRRAGRWQALKSRTTFLDENGVKLVYDQDASKLSYRPVAAQIGLLDGIRRGAGQVAPALARLVQPDVAYAAPLAEEAELCISEGLYVVAMNAAVIAAGLYLQAANYTLQAATEALTLAWASCMFNELTCPGLAAAIFTEAAAATNRSAAQYALTGAIAAAAAADAALAACRWRAENPPDPETWTGPAGGGGGGQEESGCAETWCQWTISRGADGRVRVDTDYCWCEEPM